MELGRIQISDADHFSYAAAEGRALLTFNIRDFAPLAVTAMRENRPFAGLVLSDQFPLGELLRRVLRLMGRCEQKDIANTIVWLSDFREQP